MSSRSLNGEAPEIPHLVPRRQGGLSGEILDLRYDIDWALGRLEGELDAYTIIEDEDVTVLTGAHKLNFAGSGVAASVDPSDPKKVNVVISGVGTGSGNIQTTVAFSRFTSPVLIGSVDAGRTVEKTVLEVSTPFNNGAQVSVGDIAAQGRFLTVNDTALFRENCTFLVESGHKYVTPTPIYLFPVGSVPPTQGLLKVIVYFS